MFLKKAEIIFFLSKFFLHLLICSGKYPNIKANESDSASDRVSRSNQNYISHTALLRTRYLSPLSLSLLVSAGGELGPASLRRLRGHNCRCAIVIVKKKKEEEERKM